MLTTDNAWGVRLLGEKIKELRMKRGLTITDLAKKTGLSRVLLSKIENGHVESILMSTAFAIAEALEVEVNEIF